MNEFKPKKMNAEVTVGKLIRLHPVWYSFIRYCETIKNGEIDKLKVQNGLPMLAEEVKKKIKFVKKE
jgi:hypothetical protein